MSQSAREALAWQFQLEPADYVPPVVTDAQLIAMYEILPVAAPRMTRFDGIRVARWREGKGKPRAPVLDYVLYQDALCAAVLQDVLHDRYKLHDLLSCVGLRFFMPIPISWSKRKQQAMQFIPHCSKPDNDNLMKAFYDTIFSQDAMAWDARPQKRWADEHGPRIEIWRLPPWE